MRELAVSRRTVAADVAAILKVTGARNRFHAGILINSY
jgi:DNA-binding CsgD family transcriptional regulator